MMNRSFIAIFVLLCALIVFTGGAPAAAQDANKVQVSKILAVTEKGDVELDKTGVVHSPIIAFKVLLDHPHAYELLKAPSSFFAVGVQKEGELEADFKARCVTPKDYFVAENVIRLTLKKVFTTGTLNATLSSSRLLPYKFSATIIPEATP